MWSSKLRKYEGYCRRTVNRRDSYNQLSVVGIPEYARKVDSTALLMPSRALVHSKHLCWSCGHGIS